MARAYGTRPSAFLGLDDPLVAYQFDEAVFSLEEGIDGALNRERNRLEEAELDGPGRRRVRQHEKAMRKVLDRILGIAAERRERAAVTASRPVEYLWNEDRTVITGFRYLDEEPVGA